MKCFLPQRGAICSIWQKINFFFLVFPGRNRAHRKAFPRSHFGVSIVSQSTEPPRGDRCVVTLCPAPSESGPQRKPIPVGMCALSELIMSRKFMFDRSVQVMMSIYLTSHPTTSSPTSTMDERIVSHSQLTGRSSSGCHA